MFRRQVIEPDRAPGASLPATPPAAVASPAAPEPARRGRVRRALAEVGLTTRELARSPLEGVSWTLRRRLLWPLEDRLGSSRRRLPMVGFALALPLAAALGVGGLLWAAPDHTAEPTVAIEAVAPPPATTTPVKAHTKPQPPAPTLHGAAPVFTPAKARDTAEQTTSHRHQAGAASNHSHHRRAGGESAAPAATDVTTSPAQPSATASAAGYETRGHRAGPAALTVAREFAQAFVLYETGQSAGKVRGAFAKTATLELRHALLRRPPRQPAHVKVPRARVLNAVAAPSRGQVYPVSVSLLRVGLTSELRLSMEERKGKRWLVTNVLG